MKYEKIIDIKPMVDQIIDDLIACGIDTYDEFKYMIMAYTAFRGKLHLLKLWEEIFRMADQRKPMLLEMK